jgi:hypothetical protein
MTMRYAHADEKHPSAVAFQALPEDGCVLKHCDESCSARNVKAT